MVLCGARPDPAAGGMLYQYMDPLTGQAAQMAGTQLEACYGSMGCQAVALLPEEVEGLLRGG